MINVDSFKLVDYRWERTLLYVQLETSAQLQQGDEFVLCGSAFDYRKDCESRFVEFPMTNCVIESTDLVRIRFMLAQANNPVHPGKYQLFVRRDGENSPVIASPNQVSPPAFSLKRSDLLMCGFTSRYYEVIPFSHDGMLWFEVAAKDFPGAFDDNARMEWKASARRFKSISFTRIAVATYCAFKIIFPFHENKVVFTSDSRSHLCGNMEPLYHRMQERGLFETYKPVFAFKSQGRAGRRRGVLSYIRLAYHLATSGLIICDDYQSYLYYVKYRPGVRLIQLWHACGAFKTVGFGRVGTLDAIDPFTGDHRNYSDVVVASDHDVPIYEEAFGLPSGRVKPYGIPRHDWLLDSAWQEKRREEFAELFPQAAGRKVIVFAPTFRGAGRNAAYYDYDLIDFKTLADFCRKNGFFFIIKMHPFVLEEAPIPEHSDDVFADGSSIREINDLLPSTDLLITDYSSVVYEASLLDIPTIYFAYDLEEYIGARSFYEPYEEFVSGKIVRTSEELITTIAEGDFALDRLKGFRDRNFKHLDGKSCDRIIDHIILGLPESEPARGDA